MCGCECIHVVPRAPFSRCSHQKSVHTRFELLIPALLNFSNSKSKFGTSGNEISDTTHAHAHTCTQIAFHTTLPRQRERPHTRAHTIQAQLLNDSNSEYRFDFDAEPAPGPEADAAAGDLAFVLGSALPWPAVGVFVFAVAFALGLLFGVAVAVAVVAARSVGATGVIATGGEGTGRGCAVIVHGKAVCVGVCAAGAAGRPAAAVAADVGVDIGVSAGCACACAADEATNTLADVCGSGKRAVAFGVCCVCGRATVGVCIAGLGGVC